MSKVTSICGTPAGAALMPLTEFSNGLIVSCHGALALEHMDIHRALVGRCGGENPGIPVGKGGVRSISRVATPPTVSMDRLKGVTSKAGSFICTGSDRLSCPPGMAEDCGSFCNALVGIDVLEGSFSR